MEKVHHFISGMPRAGSTLLSSLLNQREDTYAWGKSPLPDVLHCIYSSWHTQWAEAKAMPDDMQKQFLKGIYTGVFDGAYRHRDESVIIDDSRGWLSQLELLSFILDRPPKVLVPYRPLVEVLSSFEKLYRKQKASLSPIPELANYTNTQTVEGRCAFWCQNDQPIGIAVNRIRDAERRGWANSLYFVDYKMLTEDTVSVMRGVEDFLELPRFDYDFNNVLPAISSDDRMYGFGMTDLHYPQQTIVSNVSDWESILGEAGMKYAGFVV